MSTTTRAKKYYPEDILSPVEVLELMPSSITSGWLYSHWDELGGVTIANKKLILKEELYANLKRNERKVLCESVERQKTVYTCKNGNVRNELDHKIGRKESGDGVKGNDKEQAIIDHSDPFRLT